MRIRRGDGTERHPDRGGVKRCMAGIDHLFKIVLELRGVDLLEQGRGKKAEGCLLRSDQFGEGLVQKFVVYVHGCLVGQGFAWRPFTFKVLAW